MKLQEIHQEAARLLEIDLQDPTPKDAESFLAACVLLSSLVTGPSLDKVADFLCIEKEKIVPYVQNILAAGIWTDDGIDGGGWFHEEDGRAQFILDVHCTLGTLKRRPVQS